MILQSNQIAAEEHNQTNVTEEIRNMEEERTGLYNRRSNHRTNARQKDVSDHAINKRSLYNDIVQQWEHFTENTSRKIKKIKRFIIFWRWTNGGLGR